MGYIESIQPSFNFVVGLTPFCACLVTLLVVLFAFSTSESRRRLVFRLNVLAIVIALVTGILNGVTSGRAILKPFDPTPQSVYIATIIFALFPPLFYDSILLTRLLALYPVDTTPLSTLVKVLAFPLCVKCARLIVLSFYINDYVKSSPTLASLAQHAEATWFRNPYVTAEWTLQMCDNLYSSGFFLYKLHSRNSKMAPARSGMYSIGERIRQIFYISAANFVFPVIFNIGQIICITTDPSYATGTMLLLVNGYVSVIGVLCATIWFSGMEWVRTQVNTGSGIGSSERYMKHHGGHSFGSDQTTVPRRVSPGATGLLSRISVTEETPLHDLDEEKGFSRPHIGGEPTRSASPLRVVVQHEIDHA
ncbi:hypothetical protein HYDPIDRAFT_92110 [Hydnomerulius pinastri MD-312]|uniref:G-protein coupled receptors family 1 profile domain-containing protein n=1 Tax=Hydnomerulius pinastri MD-312 TaxID=994086 RepID=A0A0C9W812_9AGAM|nr:hypothetical protein HYDPIDRAFT_92110 [Hydnomerulius pinastri MD-312]